MSNQLTLAFTVSPAGSSLGVDGAAAALGAVPLYNNPTNDPVLGQFFGLTVASDETLANDETQLAIRTIVLNMTCGGPGVPAYAPPAFPCHPITATPPVLKDASLEYIGETDLFATGDVVTGATSGATGNVARANDNGFDAGTLIFSTTTGAFRTGEALTGAPSGATAVASSLEYTGETGLFVVGETVTGGGAHGVVTEINDNGNGTGTLTLGSIVGVVPYETLIAGGTSGATAFAVSANIPASTYPLLTPQRLPGHFLTTPGSNTVLTSFTQQPSLSNAGGQMIQFHAQPGVFYTTRVSSVTATQIVVDPAYSGPFSEDNGADLMVTAPSKITAVYSTSPLDTNGVAITPALPAGSGARAINLTYMDSTGAGPFTVTVNLMGTYPSQVTLAGGSVDIAVIVGMSLSIDALGAFGNSVGQITLCELSSVTPYIRADLTADEFQDLTDQAQMLITRGLVYMPPSYFALSQQSYSLQGAVPLAGEFTLPGRLAAFDPIKRTNTTIATSANQTSALAAGNVIMFAADQSISVERVPYEQNPALYTIAAVGPGTITLTTPYVGSNDNAILSSAILVTPSPAAEPTPAQLATGVAEFVNPGTAVPPPNRPLAPQTMFPAVTVGGSPAFLSGMFARTLQLALAVPVVPSAIVVS